MDYYHRSKADDEADDLFQKLVQCQTLIKN